MAESQTEHEPHQMTFLEHLEELRRRILYALGGLVGGLAIALVLGKPIKALLTSPYNRLMDSIGEEAALKVLSMQEGLILYFRIALYAGVVIACPWILYQFWQFVSAGLYPHEKRVVHTAVPFSVLLFLAGAGFFVFIVSFPMLQFFHAFNQWLGVTEMITYKEHVRFMTSMMLVFGLGFQMPLVVLVLERVGIVSLQTLRHYRRHVIIGVLIFAAAVTSPSPLDQVLLAVPMWLLYELGILLVYLSRRKRKESAGD